MKKKTIFYIDGFNVYHGLREANKYDKLGDYRWLNYQKFAENIIRPYQDLLWVKYFTARIKGDIHKQKRQGDYLDALALQPKIKIYYGNYQIKNSYDKTLKQYYSYPVEKKTDVHIVTQLLMDSFQNNFEVAYIVSADSDLMPALEAIKVNFPHLSLIACFVPRRSSVDLKALCHYCYYAKEKIFRKSLLPNSLTKPDGYIIKRPENWY